jgi:hypothetical protein
MTITTANEQQQQQQQSPTPPPPPTMSIRERSMRNRIAMHDVRVV